jgi:hypothetical protein
VIDFDDMNQRQQDGLTQVNSLQEDERAVLQHYCSLATEVLMEEGDKRKAPIDQVVINAYRYGIALGLKLQVVNGEIQGR